MFHVYIIVSDSLQGRYYVGYSARPRERLNEHNAGKNPSTAPFVPWRFAAVFRLRPSLALGRLRLAGPDLVSRVRARGEVCPT